MKSAILALLTLAAPAIATAQTTPGTYNGNVYVSSFLGACQHGYGIFGGGGGAEGLIWKGVSLGGEVSYQSFTDGWGLGMFTVQPGYHFKGKNRTSKWDPFVTFGVGIATSNHGGHGGTANLGAGANYWFKDKMAIRFVARTQAVADEGMFSFGIGISFR